MCNNMVSTNEKRIFDGGHWQNVADALQSYSVHELQIQW